MSKRTVKLPTTPPPTNPNASDPETGPEGTPLTVQQLLDIRAAWPAPTEIERAAYRSQFTDKECAEAGTLTKAVNVRNDAGGWILQIHRMKSGPDGRHIKYPGARLIYLLDLYEQLDGAIQAQEAEQGDVRETKNTAADHDDAARVTESTLYGDLDDIAGNRPVERRDLDAAATPMTTPEELVKRLRNLIELGRRWVATKDAELAVLVKDAELTPSVLDTAERAAANLEAARRGARSVRVVNNDLPAVNLIEGRVTREMKHVKGRVDRARKDHPSLTPLIPSPGTRAAIIGRTKPPRPKTEKSAPPPDTTPPEKVAKKGG